MEDIIDIDALVAPLSEESPCGSDARSDTSFDSAYHNLKDARESAMALERPDKSAQPTEKQKGGFTDVSKWQVVVNGAIDILQNSSKDLEVCALLVLGWPGLPGRPAFATAFGSRPDSLITIGRVSFPESTQTKKIALKTG